MTARSRLVPLCLAAAVTAASLTGLTAAAQGAGGLPKGKYYCRYYDESTMGVITVTGASTYRYSNGRRGTYRLSGTSLRFTSGPMKGVFKRGKLWRKRSSTYFTLFDGASWGTAYTDATCTKQR